VFELERLPDQFGAGIQKSFRMHGLYCPTLPYV